MAETNKILSRIYITPEGDLLITDLWEEIGQALEIYFPEIKNETDEDL